MSCRIVSGNGSPQDFTGALLVKNHRDADGAQNADLDAPVETTGVQ
jgi:hypothetical protein